jgi:16S rRNA U516 pseudouridylate synthase RsuA-like enzyme
MLSGDIHRPRRPNLNSALRELRRCPRAARFHLPGRLDIRARRLVLLTDAHAPTLPPPLI